MVPASSIVMMVLNVIFGVAVPVLLAWWMVKRFKVKFSTIMIGAAAFILFALVLESIVHNIVLKGPKGDTILNTPIYYALYGGLMAGLFEEIGRFLAMKFCMKKEPEKLMTGVGYGVGHGGAELLILFGIGTISTLAMAMMINSGQTDAIMAKAPANAQEQLQAQLDLIATTPASSYVLGMWERISALILQISLSVLVWTAVRKGGRWMWLLPAAILIHAAVDGILVLLQKSVSMTLLELICFAEALIVAWFALFIANKAWKNE
jgi:uncharacterized membrane protein YhfC